MINIAVMGLGKISDRVISGILEAKGANLYMLVSRDLDKASILAKKYQAEKFGDINDLYNDNNVDLVYICTPNKVHYQNIIDCLNNGLHVICEKPMLSNKEELIKVFNLS